MSRRRIQAGFTLIELLVVIAVIAILAALLLPALAHAKEQGRTAKCVSNVRQMVIGLTLYVDDHGFYPPSWYPSGRPNHYNSWFDALAPYLNDWTNSSSVFQCPSFKFRHADTIGIENGLDWGVGSYGYNANSGYGLGGPQDMFSSEPPRMVRESEVRFPARMLAILDSYLVERKTDKIMQGLTATHYIPDRYYRQGWPGYERQQKEMRARHNGHFVSGFCDGHVEKLKYLELFANDMEARRIWNKDHEPHLTPYDTHGL